MTESTVAVGAERLGHAGGHHRRRLQPIAPLVSAEYLDRLAIGIDRIAGVDDPDRRGIHRRTAVDHVADTAQPGVGVGQPQPHQQPLLGVEEAVDQQHLLTPLRQPARLVGDQRHDALGEAKRIEMGAFGDVDLPQHPRHMGVVGEAAVALADIRWPVPRLDEIDDLAIALADLGRHLPLGGRAHRIADSAAVEAAANFLQQQRVSCLFVNARSFHSSVWINP